MLPEVNKALVLRYVEEVLNQGNMAAADELLAADYRRYVEAGAAPLDGSTQKKRLAGIRAAFPDWHVTVEQLIAEGELVVFRATIRGTQEGSFQGIAPTGRQVNVSAIDILRIEGGKLIEHWGGLDLAALLQQLGAVFAPGAQGK